MENDLFDEFDLKPITGGLGFHKKSTQLGTVMKKISKESFGSDLPSALPMTLFKESGNPPQQTKNPKKITEDILSSLSKLDKRGVTFTESLPVVGTTEETPRTAAPSTYPAWLIPGAPPLRNPITTGNKVPLEKKTPPNDNKPEHHATTNATNIIESPAKEETQGTEALGVQSIILSSVNLQAISLSIPSLLMDLVVTAIIAICFLVSFFMINELTPVDILTHAQINPDVNLTLAIFFLVIFMMYSICSRSYFGRTLGEWTFECQLGSEQQIKKSHYPLLVVWRSLLVTISLFTLPLISLITKRDCTSSLTGLQLYKEA